MRDSQALSTVAKCFEPIDRAGWERMTSGSAWIDFIDAVRRIVQLDAPLGASCRIGEERRCLYPMQDYLAAAEMRALFAPPSWAEHAAFSYAHFWRRGGADAFCADRLADALDEAASLLDGGEGERAERQLLDRLAWLPAWRIELASHNGSAFYLGLVDVVVALWSRLSARGDACGAARALSTDTFA